MENEWLQVYKFMKNRRLTKSRAERLAKKKEFYYIS